MTMPVVALQSRAFSAFDRAFMLAGDLHYRLTDEHAALFAASAPNVAWERSLDEALISELRYSYGDQDGLLATHLPPIGQVVSSIGFSSLVKTSLLVRAGGANAGKVTLTLKRGQTIKVGPVYLKPEFRHRRYAVAVVEAIAEVASDLGMRTLLATVPDGHEAAVSAKRAGLAQVARLHAHYRPDLDELIFVRNLRPMGLTKPTEPAETPVGGDTRIALLHSFVDAYFHPVDERWDDWLGDVRVNTVHQAHRFVGKPHVVVGDDREAAVLIFKRGGAAKVVVAAIDGQPSQELLRRCEQLGHDFGQRKLTLFWPVAADPEWAPWPKGLLEGAVALGRAGAPVRVFSAFL